MERKPKTIFQLDSPFTDVEWPETSSKNQETILELLCSILSPIGQHRATNANPSKGKRSKKWKRGKEEDPKISRVPPPDISSFVVVGLKSITRSLESLSQKSKALRSVDCKKNDADQDQQSSISEQKSDAGQVLPAEVSGAKEAALKDTEKPLNNTAQNLQSPSSKAEYKKSDDSQVLQSPATGARSETTKDPEEPPIEDPNVNYYFSAIFVPRSSQPPILHAHLPQLIATASLAYPKLPATRLVQLPKGCDVRLCEALGLPRASFIGLLDGAPHSDSLVELVRESVREIEIPWLQEAKKSVYLPVKINAIKTFVPLAKKEQRVRA